MVPENLHHLLRLTLAQKAVIDVDAGKLFADGPDEKGRHHGGIYPAAEGKKDLLITHLLPDQFYLVGDKILHIPVCLGTADSKDKVGKSLSALFRIGRPGCIPPVICQKDRDAAVINFLCCVDLHAIHQTVGAAVEDDALHIGQRLQLLQRNIVRMNLAVDAQSPNLTGQAGILLAAQIQNQNHILPHYNTSYVIVKLSYHIRHILRKRIRLCLNGFLPLSFSSAPFQKYQDKYQHQSTNGNQEDDSPLSPLRRHAKGH